MLIDTHAHLYWDSFQKDWNEVIQNCVEADVLTIINVGVDVQKSQKALNLESEQLKFYSTIGIHPHEAYKYDNDESLKKDLLALENIYRKNPKKVIGVGEVGLDFFFQNNPDFNPGNLSIKQLKLLQRKLFNSQIDLAKKLNLPLILHIRDDRSKNPENIECWIEALDLVKDYEGILHCYSGTPQITGNIPQNFLVSFAGNITYPKNDYLKRAAETLPLEKIVLETDCPFLAPQSIRGKRNDPTSVKEIAHCIAQLRGITFEEVAKQTSENVKKLFNIS